MTAKERAYAKAWAKKNPELRRAQRQRYWKKHRNRLIAKHKCAYWENAERERARSRAYYASHKEQCRKKNKEYVKANHGVLLQKAREWKRRNREHMVLYYQRHRLSKEYGLSEYEYQVLVRQQGSACAICKRTPRRRLFVDHNHQTGTVRGLLCNRCNIGLGYIESEMLLAAQQYLAKPRIISAA